MHLGSPASKFFTLSLLILSIYPISLTARSFVLVLSQDDIIKDSPTSPDDPTHLDSEEWDEFGDCDVHKSDEELDPGSWRPIFEHDLVVSDVNSFGSDNESEVLYYSGVTKMVFAASSGNVRLMEDAAVEIEAGAAAGHPASQSC